MKFVKILIAILILVGIAGYGAYHFGTKIASNKLVDTVYTGLEDSGEIDKVKKAIENDSQLKSFIEDAKTAESSKLPFTTKEDATKVLIKKVGLSELNDMRVKLQNGSISKEKAFKEIQGKLTKEEIEALKVIAYKELYK